MRRYQATGFIPFESPPARVTRLAAIVDIVKGDVLKDDGSGLATNASITTFAIADLGVAAAACVNSGDDSLSVEIYPLDDKTLYIVPEGATLLTRADYVGTLANITDENTLAAATAVGEGIGFFIEDIDISTEALAANQYGYAIGRFRVQTTQA